MKLGYLVEYGSIKAGNIQITITRSGDQYEMSSTTKPSGLAKLFLKTHTTKTLFSADDNNFQLLSGTEEYTGKENDSLSYDVNHENKQIEFGDGEPVEFVQSDRLDLQTFPLLLMIVPLEQVSGNDYVEVSASKIRNYTYQELSEETLSLSDGDQKTWKLAKFRDNKPERTTTVWIKQEGGIPIRIESLNKGKVTRISLISSKIQ